MLLCFTGKGAIELLPIGIIKQTQQRKTYTQTIEI